MRISISDTDDRGLIWGFRLEPFEPCGCEMRDEDVRDASHVRRCWADHPRGPLPRTRKALEPRPARDGELNETTNRNLYLLSVVTTAALPATLITGIFGMNVGGLPLTESRSGFVWVLTLTLLLMAAAMIVLMRRGKP